MIRLLVDDEPFDVRYGELRSHERVLDLRAGALRREADWRSPAGQRVRVVSERLVSFVQRAVAAIHYEVEPLDARRELVLQSELVANEPRPAEGDDPRAAAALESPLSLRAVVSRGHSRPCSCTDPAQRPADGRRRWTLDRRPGGHRRRRGRELGGPRRG